MSTPLRVLITTDAFPPVCGGSGWSTWELARGLHARGHRVEVLKVEIGEGAPEESTSWGGLPLTIVRSDPPDVPVLRNMLKNERLWGQLTARLRTRLEQRPVDVVHAQHVLTTVPSIRAGSAAGIPVVATVRDYWPVCYWSTLIVDPDAPALCPACTARMMTRCVQPRAGGAAVAAWPVIPYMRRNLRTKRRALARASAVIAVSSAIARDLEARAPELAGTPMFTVPNAFDMATLDRVHAGAARPFEGPYALYAGKLAVNKGVQFLVKAYAAAGVPWPLLVAGDGPERPALETEARAQGVDVRVLGWRDRPEVLALMRHATLLAFPSHGPESLSRVLVEAAALGVPIAAMDTGGTRDILHAGETALLSSDPEGFARDLRRLAGDEWLRVRLGSAARADVRGRFSADSVVERIERVYRGLLPEHAA